MAKKGGNSNAANLQQAQELQRQQAVRSGTNAVNDTFDSQFNDDFFGQRRQSYVDYATPQLDRQYADAQRQLTFDLARSGALDSSARAQREADLATQYGTQKQAVADKALSYETTARNNVEDARSQLIQMLNATGDANAAINAANTRASALAAGDTYSPLAQLFNTGTSALAQQIAVQRATDLANGGATGGGAAAYPLTANNRAVSNT